MRRSALRIWSALRLGLRVQWRSGFPQVFLAVSVVLVVLARVTAPAEIWAVIVPAALLVEYAAVGLTLAAAQQFVERGEQSNAALAVTPLRTAEQVAALVLVPALAGTIAGAIVYGGLIGVDARLALLLPPLLATGVLCGCAGLILAARLAEFTRFLVMAVPMVAALQLPLLPYLGLVPRFTYGWHPADAALYGFANLTQSAPQMGPYALYLTELVVFAVLGLIWATREYGTRVRARVGEAE